MYSLQLQLGERCIVICEQQVRAKTTWAVFTSHANPKYFLFHPSHQIFGRMHGALNVGKKDN
jgi:hypothetical protein